jgi:hypothetical protein
MNKLSLVDLSHIHNLSLRNFNSRDKILGIIKNGVSCWKLKLGDKVKIYSLHTHVHMRGPVMT